MTTSPPGHTSVTPWLIARDADALLTFLAEVFDAEELGRVADPDGKIGHAETRIGDAVLIVVDAREGWAAAPAYLRVHVDDLATVVDRAVEAGSEVVTVPTPMLHGDTVARLSDPWGNLWWVQQHVEDVEVDEMLRRMDDPGTRDVVRRDEASLDIEMRRRTT